MTSTSTNYEKSFWADLIAVFLTPVIVFTEPAADFLGVPQPMFWVARYFIGFLRNALVTWYSFNDFGCR